MSYYGMGDYYMGAGDPFIGGLLKRVTGFATSLLPGPVGAAARFAHSRVFKPPKAPAVPQLPQIIRSYAPNQQRAPGPTGTQYPWTDEELAKRGKKRRRMNVANPKALRRAIRRESGFVKLARRALRGTGYSVVSKASRRPRHVVKESGPGSVTIQ